TDAGKTWQHVGLPHAGLIGRIRIHPQDPNLAYVAALGNIFGPNKERGVFRTRDGGKRWEHVLAVSERTGAVEVAMDVKNPNVLFAAMWTVRRSPWSIHSGSLEGGIFRSTDGGDRWQKLSGGLPTNVMVGKIGLSVSLPNPKRVYALVEAADDQGGVYRSDDGGDTWTRTYAGRNLQQRAWYYMKIYADPKDVDTVYALNTGAMKSTDGGKTFQNAGFQTHGDHHDLWINPTNNAQMISGNDGGADVTLDEGRTWSGQQTQPTAEIYRLETDNRWPYYVYGAQQDNSTIAVPSSNVGETYPVGGGESGHIAVDPRNHHIIYAGSYGGAITRMDRFLGVTESIRVYADMQTGQRAADMKYRFQWNAPIRISPHNPDVVYTTSQVVHRTKDGGQTWEVISPDLTTNNKSKQGYSGGEGVTRDNTGVEVYCVIFAFEESPVTPGLLWAGSNDGRLHLSRDSGKSWQEITPRGLPADTTINTIELSRSNAGRAIVSAYRYMLNDFTPYVYETDDYGTTWKRIADGTNGIPAHHFVRVVREDPNRPGLLYAGTEYGMYISFDGGADWQRFQNNLPITPIMDLKVHRNELAVATEGRAFWILEGLPVLQQLTAGLENERGVLFKPADAYRQGGPLPTFYYWLKDQPADPVTLEVIDASGSVVHSATGQPGSGVRQPPSPIAPPAGRGRGGFGGFGGRGRGGEEAVPAEAGRGAAGVAAQPEGGPGRGRGGRGGGRGGAPVAAAHQGLNRSTWDARLASPYTMPQGIVMWGGGQGPAPGPKAPSGTYTVKITSGAWSQSQTFKVGTDPRFPPMSDAEAAEQAKMALQVAAHIKQLYDTLAQIRDAKTQAAAIAKKSEALAPASRTLSDKLVAVEGEITQLQGEGGQDALNYPGRLDNQWVALYQNIVSLERKLNQSVKERYADLKPPTDQLMQRAAAVLKTDTATFNAAAEKAGVSPGIVLK
ncbi:MAG: glycosyl hydrolase, partial [Acidobacteria bacterium]|nr:glycosyl hydrolase [Acidobacteriota bacterium]